MKQITVNMKRMKTDLKWKRRDSDTRFIRRDLRTRKSEPKAYRVNIYPNGQLEVIRIWPKR